MSEENTERIIGRLEGTVLTMDKDYARQFSDLCSSVKDIMGKGSHVSRQLLAKYEKTEARLSAIEKNCVIQHRADEKENGKASRIYRYASLVLDHPWQFAVIVLSLTVAKNSGLDVVAMIYNSATKLLPGAP